uniref:ATP synthase F0 subunit 8 n=1 Tax=Aureoumbra lagunensis TaxID=44058 RepID=A0A7U0QGG4_9STRA|nr:ATP synthase F0 subunit 8 [Aureoumbra lagunensis]QQW50412.1 ATP synthase F0 subunit 8 [Aureoumbra lagunensis]
MPQFDKITFFNQIFWLIITFLLFYLIFLREFLPKIGSVLKVRVKKLTKNNFFAKQLHMEKKNILMHSSQTIEKIANFSKVILFAKMSFSERHRTKTVQNLPVTNKLLFVYLERFLQISLKKFI